MKAILLVGLMVLGSSACMVEKKKHVEYASPATTEDSLVIEIPTEYEGLTSCEVTVDGVPTCYMLNEVDTFSGRKAMDGTCYLDKGKPSKAKCSPVQYPRVCRKQGTISFQESFARIDVYYQNEADAVCDDQANEG